jgi:hypothetical protein
MSGFNLEDYQTVVERIHEFKTLYPDGTLLADCYETKTDDGIKEWVCVAHVRKTPDGAIYANGHASEIVGANKFAPHNALELAETSARGRALLAFGIGTTGKSATRDEVASARAKEETPKPVQQEDPWAKGMEILGDALGAEPLANQTTYSCSHGVMVYSTGISKKNNKPWAAYKCPDNVQLCDPKWMKVG